MMFQARLSNVSNRRFKAHNYPNASLVKRLLAMMYDSLLIMAVWMLVGYVFIAFNDGEAVSGPLFNSTVFLVTFILRFILDSVWANLGHACMAFTHRVRSGPAVKR